MVEIFVRFEIMAEIFAGIMAEMFAEIMVEVMAGIMAEIFEIGIMAEIFEIEIMAGITASGVVEMAGICGTARAATPAALWSHHTRILAIALPCTCTGRSPAG